ncbi:hypothetical protein ES703_15707 [subsurface metagenome]
MKKKEYWEYRNNEDKTLVNLYPELNQSGIYDNEGNILPEEKREQYDPIPRGFIDSGIFFRLTARDKDIYFFLSSRCNPQRNTQIKSEKITRLTGIPDCTIKESFRRLEFYHFIDRRVYSLGPKLRRRITTLLRWNTAYKRLVKEGKIKAISGKEIIFIKPYKRDKKD